jgi:hypothetical protein
MWTDLQTKEDAAEVVRLRIAGINANKKRARVIFRE